MGSWACASGGGSGQAAVCLPFRATAGCRRRAASVEPLQGGVDSNRARLPGHTELWPADLPHVGCVCHTNEERLPGSSRSQCPGMPAVSTIVKSVRRIGIADACRDRITRHHADRICMRAGGGVVGWGQRFAAARRRAPRCAAKPLVVRDTSSRGVGLGACSQSLAEGQGSRRGRTGSSVPASNEVRARRPLSCGPEVRRHRCRMGRTGHDEFRQQQVERAGKGWCSRRRGGPRCGARAGGCPACSRGGRTRAGATACHRVPLP
jgi:hypothetical protein